ncbi:MAG: hypothetical protein VX938_02865, partial [Myxococcota bacterium]|nr:hypothetical protein [Myxococcota bacterium]
ACAGWDESALTWEAFSADCSTGDVLQTVLVGPPSDTVCFDIQGEVTLSLTALAETGLMVEPLGGVDPSEVETISFHSTETGAGPQLTVTYEETSVSQCKENWIWSEWSLCNCEGQQKRTGTEQNGCAATPVVTETLPCEANPCPTCSLCDGGACVPEPSGLPCGTCRTCDGAGACALVLDGTSCDGEQDLACVSGECICPQNTSFPTPEDAYEPNGSASCADCLSSDDQATACADLPNDEAIEGSSWVSCESLMGSWSKGACQGSCDWKADPAGDGLETACVLGAAGGSGGYTAQCAPEVAPEDLDVCVRTVFGTGDGVGPVTLTGVLGGDDTVDHYGFLVQEEPAAELDPVVTLTGIPEGADYQLCVGWSPGATPGDVNICGWPTSWPDTATRSGGDELAPITCQVGSEEAPSGVLGNGLHWCCSDNPGNASEYVAIGGEGLAWGADGHGNLMVRVVQSASGCWLQDYELEVQHF